MLVAVNKPSANPKEEATGAEKAADTERVDLGEPFGRALAFGVASANVVLLVQLDAWPIVEVYVGTCADLALRARRLARRPRRPAREASAKICSS